MKIAFVIPAYYPAVIGESLYTQELAGYLAEKGNEVKVYTHMNRGLLEKEVVEGVEVTRVKIKEILGGKYYFSSDYVKAVVKEKFDVIHSHHYGYFPATAGFIAAKMTKTPHVFGPYYHPPVYGRKRWIQFTMYHMTQGLPILRFSDAVLPHTEYEKKMLLKIGGRNDNMNILPNIVDTNLFKPGKKKGKIVLFTSNLIYEKGAHIALSLAKDMLEKRKDVKFVFIGNVYEKDLIPQIAELGRKNVLFLKNLKKEELIKWYQRASVVLLPSKYEAFSRVLAEAEACGTPVIATKVGAIPEVVEDEKAGFLVDYGNWEKMKDHIEYILDNPSIGKKMGRHGHNYVKSNFDKKIVCKKLCGIYKKVLG